MMRMYGAVAVGLLAVAAAQAHFPFIVPEEGGTTAKVVFSDDLAPDTKVDIEKLAGTKLTLRDSGGKDTPLDWKKADGFYQVTVPGAGSRVVYGVTEYGVLQKGEAKPFRLTYLPKAVLGPAPTMVAAVGGPLKVEILVSAGLGKTKFQVLHEGKPVHEAEVTVLLPGGTKKAVKTDSTGFTPTFDATGRYGAFARVTEPKAGEHAGKKYDETRYYATLVVDIGK
jgi:uncharacterized GH25 family protein